MPDLKPSDFCVFPYGSLCFEGYTEGAALDIMELLKASGNEWRPVGWDEYIKYAREHEGSLVFTENSHRNFYATVSPYCLSPEKAAEFSPAWAKIFKPLTP